jgi:hypothetical protein
MIHDFKFLPSLREAVVHCSSTRSAAVGAAEAARISMIGGVTPIVGI